MVSRPDIVFCGLTLDCPGGIAGITRRLFHAIARRAPACRFRILLPASMSGLRRGLELSDEHFDLIEGKSPVRHPLGTTIWWQNRHALHARRRYPDSLFVSCSDFWAVVHPRRSAVVLHDAINELRPDDASRPHSPRRIWRRLCNRWAAGATAVLTVSSSAGADLVSHRGIPRSKLIVTHPWLAESLTRPPDAAARAAVRSTYSLPPKYWLYVGNFRKHKNIERLLEAFAQVRQAGDQTPLVMAGALPVAAAETCSTDVVAHARQLGLGPDAVIFTGPISDALLPALYAESALFVFPTLFEGFGFPALEALAMGAPVIGSRVTSVPEVIGPELACFSPENVGEIVDAWKRAAAAPDAFRRPYNPYFGEEQGVARWLQAFERALGTPGRFGGTALR